MLLFSGGWTFFSPRYQRLLQLVVLVTFRFVIRPSIEWERMREEVGKKFRGLRGEFKQRPTEEAEETQKSGREERERRKRRKRRREEVARRCKMCLEKRCSCEWETVCEGKNGMLIICSTYVHLLFFTKLRCALKEGKKQEERNSASNSSIHIKYTCAVCVVNMTLSVCLVHLFPRSRDILYYRTLYLLHFTRHLTLFSGLHLNQESRKRCTTQINRSTGTESIDDEAPLIGSIVSLSLSHSSLDVVTLSQRNTSSC